jgi:hypothetical protein
VRSSTAAAYASACGSTCTTSAPRSSCACAIWPIAGNSFAEMTMRFRPPPKSRPLTSALTAAETEVCSATSSASAPSSSAKRPRIASDRSTQNPHSAPFASQPSRYSS